MIKKTCPACYGKGTQYSNKEGLIVTCPVCYGSGKVKDDRDDGIY